MNLHTTTVCVVQLDKRQINEINQPGKITVNIIYPCLKMIADFSEFNS